MKTTIADIETAIAHAETEIAKYAAVKRSLAADRDAGKLTAAYAAKEMLRASIPAAAAQREVRAMSEREVDGTPSDALLDRAEKIDVWGW